MSALSRTCLRLAAVAALRNATAAEDRVFDSRIGELPFDRPEEIQPLLTVFTEEQSGDALAHQNGGPPFRATVDLVVECAMAVAQRLNNDGQIQILYPETSDELEAGLDLLEAQVSLALFESLAPLSQAFRKAFVRVQKANSIRFTSPDAQHRVAIRYVSFTCEAPDQPLRSYVAGADGLARLPQPFAAIAATWAQGTPERDIAESIAASLAQPSAPLFKAMRVNPADDPPASGPVEAWTPPDPETPAAIDGPTFNANWTTSP